MRVTHDAELQGYAMVFEGPMELAQQTAKAQEGLSPSHPGQLDPKTGSYTNTSRKFNGWGDLVEAYAKPWEAGVKRVSEMLEELRNEHIEEPVSRLRKARWTDGDGEIDVDRVMRGTAEAYREVRRSTYKGPTSIAVLCNSDAYAADSPESVFWRGAAAIACIDLLEANGYGCEVHLWCRGARVYEMQNTNQFTTCPIKQCDQPLDIDCMVNALSDWYLRLAIFGSFTTAAQAGAKQRGIGWPLTHEIGPWEKYIDISANVAKVAIPAVKTREAAIRTAKQILNTVREMTN